MGEGDHWLSSIGRRPPPPQPPETLWCRRLVGVISSDYTLFNYIFVTMAEIDSQCRWTTLTKDINTLLDRLLYCCYSCIHALENIVHYCIPAAIGTMSCMCNVIHIHLETLLRLH